MLKIKANTMKNRNSKMIFGLKKHYFIAGLVLVLAGCARNEPPSEVIYTKVFNPYHVVQGGESVESISKLYGMSEQDFIAINSLHAPYELIQGQRVLVHRKASEVTEDASEDVETKKLDEEKKDDKNKEEEFVPVDESLKEKPKEEIKRVEESVTPVDSSKYVWPVKGRILQKFGRQKNGDISNGITISAPEGTPVVAIKAGDIKYANSTVEGYGKMVIIRHPDGMMSTYAHLKDFAAGIKPGKKVSIATRIGRVGKTGCKRPQLQLQIRGKDRKPINPLKLLG